jgi:hypothetical protein
LIILVVNSGTQANINIPDLHPGDSDLVITIDGVASAPVRISMQ